MSLRRIYDEVVVWPRNAPCYHPDHNPPSHMVLPNGLYEHTCSGCGLKRVFRVNKPTPHRKS